MRLLLIPIGLLALSLAGCADGAAPEVDDFTADDGLQATATTGIIRGIVVDTAIAPLTGVTITGDNIARSTDENGAFALADLSPGSHCLVFEKIGYHSINSCTLVEAGIEKPDLVRILMEANPDAIPYVIPFKFDGMVKCGASYIAACGVFDIVGQDVGDKFIWEQELEGAPTHITMEALWEGSQPTGSNFQLRLGHSPAGPATVDNAATGPSPQQARINATIIQAAGIGAGSDLVGRMFVWEMEGTNIEGYTGVCVPVVLTTWCHGPGVAIDQKFELFTHAFYGYEPGADWRFSEGEPPAPPA
jgi:hypothetical protein